MKRYNIYSKEIKNANEQMINDNLELVKENFTFQWTKTKLKQHQNVEESNTDYL